MAKVFVPRTVPPQIGEYWWSTENNHCISIYNGTVLPNCVGYAHGRFCEILGYFHPNLPRCNAGLWLDEIKKQNVLKWGTTPKLGAVAVWKESGQYGHVGIVEYIYDDGSIMLSESGYGADWNKRFWNSGPRVAPNWYGQPYIFQGFIYNPGTEGVTHVAPYQNGIKYGSDVSGVTTLYADQVASFEKSITSSSISTSSNVVSESAPTNSGSEAAVKKFINSIVLHSGQSNDGYDWVQRTTGYKSSGWAAAMICAASIEAGLSDIIPADVFSYSSLASTVVEKLGGTYIAASKQGGTENPQVGDIFGIYTGKNGTKYSVTTLGVVTEIQDMNIRTIEGDFEKSILPQTRRIADIYWYVRPNWSRISSVSSDSNSSLVSSNFSVESSTVSSTNDVSNLSSPVTAVNTSSTTYSYDSISASRTELEPVQGPPQVDYLRNQTRKDATLREVTYLTEQAKPSIKMTGTKLSAINYSGLLGKVYDVMGLENIQSPGTADNRSFNFNNTYFISNAVDLQGVPQVIFEFLRNKGLSASKVVGFLANIQAESGFKTNAVNSSSGASGICQWKDSRKTNMIKYCGSDWKNNLSSQLDFMWFELQSTEQQTLTSLQSVIGEGQSSAEQATEIICRTYERPDNVEVAVATRKKLAENLWDNLGSSYTSEVLSTETGSVTTYSGNSYEKGNIIEIPVYVTANKITCDYKSYSNLSKIFPKNSDELTIYEIWNQKQSSKYYISTIDNKYLVASSTMLGHTGDAISIVLDDGSYFNAVLAEARDTQSYYTDTSSTHVVEWLTIGTDYLAVESGLNQSGWLGRNIVKVINYGSWLH